MIFILWYYFVIFVVKYLRTISKTMSDKLKSALKQLNFKWLPKHLNHIAENIVLKKRNISFLAINALFRQESRIIKPAAAPFIDSFLIADFVSVQKNDKLRMKAEKMVAVFRLDKHDNIIVITAYSESDE